MGAAASRLLAYAREAGWCMGRRVYGLVWNLEEAPIAELQDGNASEPQGEQPAPELTARSCFLAGLFITKMPALRGRLDEIRMVIREALNGDLCSLEEARRRLMARTRSGVNILHILGQELSISTSIIEPHLFIELLDFQQGDGETLDCMMTANSSGHHPLFLAMLSKARGSSVPDRAMHLMRRVSPKFMWNHVSVSPKFMWSRLSGQNSTALHVACAGTQFTAEERLEIIGRIPLEVLASVLGPHGRTPILHAAACGAGDWVESLLDCLPPEALTVSDDHNCTLVHLMACLPDDSTRERILGLVPDVEHLCSEVATSIRAPLCKGNAAVFHLAKGCDALVPTLVSLTTDESLLASEAWIGKQAEHRCSLLQFAAGRANADVCKAIFERVTAEQRNVLLQKDCFGLTPLHALLQAPAMRNESPAYVFGRPKLSNCLSSIVDIAELFLGVLTDDELQLLDGDGNSVLVQLLVMLTKMKAAEADIGIFNVCQELVDRTSQQCWPGSGVLLRLVVKISQRSLRHCDGRLRFIASVLARASSEDFYDNSDLYVDMLMNFPNVEAARLVLEAAPRDAFRHPGNQMGNLCNMLCTAAVGRPVLGQMLRLLLHYIPPAILLSAVSPLEPAPFAMAIIAGNGDAVAAMLAACPEAMTAVFGLEEGNVTAMELAQRRNAPRIASMLQPLAKGAQAY